MRRAVGIIRVSQVNGRGGESFVSPAEQRERIEAACERDGLQLIDVHEELDVSGGTPLDQRAGLRAAVESIEAGDAQVVIASYFDRLFRSLTAQGDVVQRVEQAGGQVLAVDVGQVTEASAGQWLSGTMLGAVSEYARRTAKERSGDAQQRAVERGVLPWPNIPPGYRRGEDGVLVVEPAEAKLMRKAFQMRGDGATYAECRSYLTANGIERSWHGVQHAMKSRVYLGEIHFGKLVNLAAHEPLVDADTWAKAQRSEVRGSRPKSNRLLARQGVLRCGSCGGRMSVGTQTQGGRKYSFYRCSPTSDCQNRQAIGADIAEQVVVEAVRAVLADVEGRASVDDTRRQTEAELAHAQGRLDAAMEAFADLAGEPVAAATLRSLSETRDGISERLDQIGGGSVSLPIGADWGRLSLDEQRAFVRATVERATVAPGKGPGRVAVQLFSE
jgi:site-specific DNA recombinase